MKICPICNATNLVLMTSLNKKICGTCGCKIVWNLGKDQRAMLTELVGEEDATLS